jgi:molecular chaperone DnaJ
VAPHERFGVKGKNLTVSVPISFSEAVLGADIAVPTLDGSRVTVRIPPGTPSGRTFRVRGRGVPAKKGAGDLLATVEIIVPKNPTPEQRKAIDELAAADASARAERETVS